MKKLTALVLTVIMLFSMCMPLVAFASDEMSIPAVTYDDSANVEPDAMEEGVDPPASGTTGVEPVITAPPAENSVDAPTPDIPGIQSGDSNTDSEQGTSTIPTVDKTQPDIGNENPPVSDPTVSTPGAMASSPVSESHYDIVHVIGTVLDAEVTLSDTVVGIAYAPKGTGDFSDLIIDGTGVEGTPVAWVDGAKVTLYASWLETLPAGEYDMRFTFASSKTEVLTLTVTDGIDRTPPTENASEEPEKLSEDDLTETERVNINRVQDHINALPSVDEVSQADDETRNVAYDQAQSVYDEYTKLTPIEKLLVDITPLESLFNYFNAQIMPIAGDVTAGTSIVNDVFTTSLGTRAFNYTGASASLTVNITGLNTTMTIHTLGGAPAYTLAPDRDSDPQGYTSVGTNVYWDQWLNANQHAMIRAILAYGYPACESQSSGSHDHNVQACQVATQIAIWEVVTGCLDSSWNHVNALVAAPETGGSNTNFYDNVAGIFKTRMTDLYAMCSNHWKKPDWLRLTEEEAHANVVKLAYNSATNLYEGVVTSADVYDNRYKDDNWFLNQFIYPNANKTDYPWASGWTFSLENNDPTKLKITATVAALCDSEHSVYNSTTGQYEFIFDVVSPWMYESVTTNLKVSLYNSVQKGEWPSSTSDLSDEFSPYIKSNETFTGDRFHMVIEGVPRFPIEITKTGECFYNAVQKEDQSGYELDWETQPRSGAVFDIIAAENIVSRDGSLTFHNAGDKVATGLTTGANGKIKSDPLYVGKYYVVETKAPYGFTINNDPDGDGKNGVTVTMVWPDLQVPGSITQVYPAACKDQAISATVSATKKDSETKNNVVGSSGVFGLYAGDDIYDFDQKKIVVPRGALIEKATINTEGTARFTSRLPYDHPYYVKEITAPKGYILNADDVFDFTYNYKDDSLANATQDFPHIFSNTPVKAAISFTKEDTETGKDPQGDATFVGAVYGLYAREDILHPDGYTNNPNGGENINSKAPKLLYATNELVARLTTQEIDDGVVGASIDNLYPGKYYLKEITAPTGYTLDKTEYDLDCSYVDQNTPLITKETTVRELVIKQVFHLIKVVKEDDGSYSEMSPKLAGAGFSFWLLSDLTDAGYTDVDEYGVPVVPAKNPDGTWPVQPIVVTADGGREVFSDDSGYVETIGIPYGIYVVSETTVPHNYIEVRNFVVTIPTYDDDDDHDFPGPQEWGVAPDGRFKALLKIIKMDAETNRVVLRPNAKFRVYDVDNSKYVVQHASYPIDLDYGTLENPYTTDETGTLQMIDDLSVGHYRVEEVRAPSQYLLNDSSVEVFIDQDTPHYYNKDNKMFIINVVYKDYPAKGELTVTKVGEVLTGFGKDFEYEEQNLAGAEFNVVADEDIHTADNQTDENGDHLTAPQPYGYAEGDIVATIRTDNTGMTATSNLPMGRYRVVETKAPGGYALPLEDQTVTFVYVNDETPVIKMGTTVTDVRQKVTIKVTKRDNETGDVLKGAEFALYAAEDIHGGPYYAPSEKVIVKAGTELTRATTGEDGVAQFNLDLPLGKYYVVETKAPDGYASVGNDSIVGNERIDIDATYRGQTVYVVENESEIHNNPTKVQFRKFDINTNVEISGSRLEVIDKYDRVVDNWISDKNTDHIIERLLVGETYTLREVQAPYGYLKADDVQFTVEDTDEIQIVDMYDDVPTASLIIDKDGEFLSKIDPFRTIEGWIRHLFSYLNGPMDQVTFEVYAAEDVVAADGVSPNYYNKGDYVATITTDEAGIATLNDVTINDETVGLPLGKYMVVEVETQAGFVLDSEPRYVDLLYIDQNTPLVTFTKGWQNIRQRMTVNVTKVDSRDVTKRLAGAQFALYAGEDIYGSDGSVLMKENTLIEEQVTGEDGTLTVIADLPYGYTYYIQECSPAPGYATNHDPQAFTFECDNSQEIFVKDLTFTDEIIKFNFSKKDLTTDQELPGSSLRIKDADGNEIDAWESTDEPHYLEGLVVGETYVMEETHPADGYSTADNIEFIVEDTGDIQTVTMTDDVTKVNLAKKELATGDGLANAQLQLLDEKNNIVDEWTSDGAPHYIEKLIVGKDYTMHEAKAPDGYATSSDVKITIADTSEIQDFEMLDDTTKVEITKYDSQEKALKDAKLQLLDSYGAIVEEWMTTEEAHHIEKLLVGETYKLHEAKPAAGYASADDIEFTIEDTGDIQNFKMVDETTKTQIAVKDIDENLIPGAKLELRDAAGKVVEAWESGEEPHLIEKLVVGETYTLHEVEPPAGYASAEDIEILIADTRDIQSFEMINETTKTEIIVVDMDGNALEDAKIQLLTATGDIVDAWVTGEDPYHIEKLVVGKMYTIHFVTPPAGYASADDVAILIADTGDVQSYRMVCKVTRFEIAKQNEDGDALPGAKLELRDANDEVIETWESGEEPHAIEKLVVGETYVLHEAEAPEGFDLADDIEIEVEDTSDTQEIKMIDNVTPKTGDSNNNNLLTMMLLSLAMFCGACGAIFAKVNRKRCSNSGR